MITEYTIKLEKIINFIQKNMKIKRLTAKKILDCQIFILWISDNSKDFYNFVNDHLKMTRKSIENYKQEAIKTKWFFNINDDLPEVYHIYL